MARQKARSIPLLLPHNFDLTLNLAKILFTHMPAAYDTYDYPAYWIGRDYEHGSEIIAIKAYLEKIPKLKKILEIGGGFGRLTPTYSHRAKKIILTDPSSQLLRIARKNLIDKRIVFLQAGIDLLPGKIRNRTVDLAIMIRVLHHIEEPDRAFEIISKILKKRGYLILEFANKRHLKATVSEFFKGNFTFILDIFPKDLRSKQAKTKKYLPFLNYHPDIIYEKLEKAGFEIIEKRSVSNIRSPLIKKLVQVDTLLFFEKFLQKTFSRVNFGPSIFVLARKRD